MKAIFTFVFIIAVITPAYSQNHLPIIDMHAHALPADHQGPPPMGMCVPLLTPLPAWDTAEPYSKIFMKMFKEPECDDPVWSPMTDSALMTETIKVMESLNMFGVLSGKPERVAAWMKAAPGLFYPGILFRVDKNAPTPDSLVRFTKPVN